MVVTLHGCYHWGFNTGRNFNEATNFALDDWPSKFKVGRIDCAHSYAHAFLFSTQVYKDHNCTDKGKTRFEAIFGNYVKKMAQPSGALGFI